MTTPAEVKPNKLKSVKFWITLWALGMISYIVFGNRTEFVLIAQLLCIIPLAYLGVNVWQKQIYSKADEK